MTNDRYVDRGEPPSLRGVTDRIRQVAKDDGVPENRLRHRLGVVVLADIITAMTDDDAGERILIKGGTAMMFRLGLEESRFSKDLDTMLRGSMDDFTERLRERGRTAHYGWTFVVAKAETIEVPGMLSKPRRLTVKMAYKGKPYSTIQLEIAAEEGNAADTFDTVQTEDLKTLGFPIDATEQHLLTIPYQVAQKLHACTARDEARPNDRAHDLVDLALLEDPIRQDPEAVRAACVEIFELRAMQEWPPDLEAEDHWPAIYTRAVEGLEDAAPATLDDAITLVNDLIRLIDGSRDEADTTSAP